MRKKVENEHFIISKGHRKKTKKARVPGIRVQI
jgi:hypothetical protein